MWSLCFCRVIATSSWRWKFKRVKKLCFLRVESLICLPHPQSSEEELPRVNACCLVRKRSPRGSGNMMQCMNTWFLSQLLLICILKVCLFNAWLTFILAITCKGKWIIKPRGIIEPIQHIYFSPFVSFLLKRLWRLSTLFPFAVMYSTTNSTSALRVFDANSLDCSSWLCLQWLSMKQCSSKLSSFHSSYIESWCWLIEQAVSPSELW